MSGGPAEKHISAQEFCKNCVRGRAWLHQWTRSLVVCSRENVRRIGDQKSRNQSTVHVVSMTPFRGPHQISSCRTLQQRERNLFQHVVSFPSRSTTTETPHLSGSEIIPCATIGGYCLSPLFFPLLPLPKNTLQTFSTLLSNQTRFS